MMNGGNLDLLNGQMLFVQSPCLKVIISLVFLRNYHSMTYEFLKLVSAKLN